MFIVCLTSCAQRISLASPEPDCASEKTLFEPPSLSDTIHRALDKTLRRIPSILSLASEDTAIDSSPTSVDAHSAPSSSGAASPSTDTPKATQAVLRDHASQVFCCLMLVGIPQGLNGAINSLLGYAILHLTRPGDAAYDAKAVAATLTGLVGALTFHAICVFVLLSFLCISFASYSHNSTLPPPSPSSSRHSAGPTRLRDPDTIRPPRQAENRCYSPEERASSPIRTQVWGVWPIWIGIPLCMGRATAVGALGAMLLKHTALHPMDLRHAAMANAVGSAILYMPRGAMAVVWRLVLVRQYRAYQERRGRRGIDPDEAAWWLYR